MPDDPVADAPKMPRTARRLLTRPLTARRAARMIAEFTLLATLAGGTPAWLIDRGER